MWETAARNNSQLISYCKAQEKVPFQDMAKSCSFKCQFESGVAILVYLQCWTDDL